MRNILPILTVILLIASASFVVLRTEPRNSTGASVEATSTIESKLEGKTIKEKANIKASEIAKVDFRGQYTDTKYGNITVQIENIEQIEGGIQVFARAWKDGKQLGFGADGTVDIERFRIFNPPALVDDANGPVIRESSLVDIKTKQTIVKQRHLREDPAQAIRQTLAHTISVSAQDGDNIIPGKVGNTTDTLFPVAGANSPVDGYVDNNAIDTYANVRNATAGVSVDVTSSTLVPFVTNYLDVTRYYVRRSFFGFDVTTVGSDTMTAVTLSIAGGGGAKENANTDSIVIVSGSPASNNNLVTGDFDQIGSTSYATTTFASYDITTGVYNDFVLDAAGIAYVDSWTGVGFLSARDNKDLMATAPTGGNSVNCTNADQAGTTSDPKLVIVHSAVVASGGTRASILE